MNKYDKAVLAKLEQLCADGGLEYKHPDPNDSAAFNDALEYYTDAGRSDIATLLTGAVVPIKFDEAEKQVKAGSRRDSANELGERVVLKDDSLGRRRLNNKTMILAGLAAGAVLVLFVVWKNAFAFPTTATPVVVATPAGTTPTTKDAQGGTATQPSTATTSTTATTVTPPASGGAQASPTAEALSGSEPTQPVSVPQRPYTQPYVQQAPSQVPTPPTFQQTPVMPAQPVAVNPRFQGQQLPVQVPAPPVRMTSVPSVSQTAPVAPYRLVPRTLTPPVMVRPPAAARLAGNSGQAASDTARGATVVYSAPPPQKTPAVAYSRPAAATGGSSGNSGTQATVYTRPAGSDAAASSAPQAIVYTKVSSAAGSAPAGAPGSGTVYNRSGGLSDPAAAAGSSMVAYRIAGTPTAVSADGGTAPKDAGAVQRVVYQRGNPTGTAGGSPAADATSPAAGQGSAQAPGAAGVSGLTAGLNALSGGAIPATVAGTGSTIASLASGSTATGQNPYRKGQRLKAKLLTGFATANGAAVPVLAQSDDGVTWIGSGTLINGTLVQIDFRTAVFPDGRELDVTASAFSSDGYPGVSAQVTDTNPTLVTDILRGAASGASDYVIGLINAGTNVVLPSGGVVTSKASASLGDNILGAVGGLFKIPNVSSNFVRVARLSQDTPIQIVYGVSNSGR